MSSFPQFWVKRCISFLLKVCIYDKSMKLCIVKRSLIVPLLVIVAKSWLSIEQQSALNQNSPENDELHMFTSYLQQCRVVDLNLSTLRLQIIIVQAIHCPPATCERNSLKLWEVFAFFVTESWIRRSHVCFRHRSSRLTLTTKASKRISQSVGLQLSIERMFKTCLIAI